MPGPWAYEHVGEGAWCIGAVHPPVKGEIVEPFDEATGQYGEKPIVVEYIAASGNSASMADAAFIAHARTDVPALLADNARLRKIVWAADHLRDLGALGLVTPA